MNTIVVSDLHLGSPLFKKKYEFMGLIKSPSVDIVVLNGDVIDVWENDVDKIVDRNQSIIEAINVASQKKRVIYIQGNHDPKFDEIKKIFPNVEIVPFIQLNDLFIIHGHEFDKMVSKYSWWAKLLFVPHWIGERFGLNIKAFFRELTQSIANKRNKDYYKDLVKDIDNSAIEKYKGRCKYLILGHTHSPGVVPTQDCIYINGGDLIHNSTYVEFNIETNVYNLKRM